VDAHKGWGQPHVDARGQGGGIKTDVLVDVTNGRPIMVFDFRDADNRICETPLAA